MIKYCQRLLLFVIFSCRVFSSISDANALPFLPYGSFILKPYAGVSWYLDSYNSSVNPALQNGINRIYNDMEFHAGLRITKYFAIQLGYFRLNYSTSINDIKNNASMNGFAMDGILYYPIIDIMGNAIEVYSNIGFVSNNAALGDIKEHKVSAKFGGGLQFRLIATIAVRAGYEFMLTNFNAIPVSYLHLIKIGVDTYF